MFSISEKKYLLMFSAVSFSIFLQLYYSVIKPIVNYDANRVYDLRWVPREYRASLLELFLDNKYEEGSVLILGDSQPNGHRLPEQYIFSSLLASQLGKRVINSSFRDARILDSIYTLRYAVSQNMRFSTIVLNVNQSHVKEANFQRMELEDRLDYRIGIIKISNKFKTFPMNFNPTELPSETFKSFPNIPDYLYLPSEGVKEYTKYLSEFIALANSLSENVIVYMTTHAHSEIERLGYDQEALAEFSSTVSRLCREQGVTFWSPEIREVEYFLDIVHFNVQGHRLMAELLKNKLLTLSPGSG